MSHVDEIRAAHKAGTLPLREALRAVGTLLGEIDRLGEDLRDVAVARIADALPLSAMPAALEHAIPIDRLRCPLCGSTVEWRCSGGVGSTGRAHCEAGRHVGGVLLIGSGPGCPWKGTRTARLGDGSVVALYPVETAAHVDVVPGAVGKEA